MKISQSKRQRYTKMVRRKLILTVVSLGALVVLVSLGISISTNGCIECIHLFEETDPELASRIKDIPSSIQRQDDILESSFLTLITAGCSFLALYSQERAKTLTYSFFICVTFCGFCFLIRVIKYWKQRRESFLFLVVPWFCYRVFVLTDL